MNKKNLFILLTLMLISSVYGQENIKEKIDSASQDVSDFFGATSASNIIVVSGSKISVEDKILFNMLKSNINMPV